MELFLLNQNEQQVVLSNDALADERRAKSDVAEPRKRGHCPWCRRIRSRDRI